MAGAYTSGLQVTPFGVVRRMRRLPLKGEVVVSAGDRVEPDAVVARADIPGILRTVRAADILGVDPEEVPGLLCVEIGAHVTAGQVLASSSSFWGLFKSECKAPVDGTVELVSPATGAVSIRDLPRPVEVNAYIRGEIAEVFPGEGVVVKAEGALIQGIFGVGGERQGPIRIAVGRPDQPLTEAEIDSSMRGAVVVGGSGVTAAALMAGAEVGVAGIVAGAIIDRDLIDFIGFDIGVAITGSEEIPLTLILTEGFGSIPMAGRTFNLLRELEGSDASINGATQIRAGVIRPEILVPREAAGAAVEEQAGGELAPGAAIRVIREPYFGQLGRVSSMPPELRRIPTGAMTRVLIADLADGRSVTVPRANVELISG